jgi:hypothetical protein
VREFILQKNTLVRGLAHPAVFAAGAQGGTGQMSQFQKFGAVKVSPGSILEVIAILSFNTFLLWRVITVATLTQCVLKTMMQWFISPSPFLLPSALEEE